MQRCALAGLRFLAIGVINTHKPLAEPRAHLRQLESAADWVKSDQRHRNYGEWRSTVMPNGSQESHLDPKSEERKSSRDLLRGILFTSNWLEQPL